MHHHGLTEQKAKGFHRVTLALAILLLGLLGSIPACSGLQQFQQTRSLMDTYVGHRTSEKVLSGMIKRGDADVINAALWYSDLRDFTHLTETLPAEQILEMLNTYFEFVSAAVTARGGEILRFIILKSNSVCKFSQNWASTPK